MSLLSRIKSLFSPRPAAPEAPRSSTSTTEIVIPAESLEDVALAIKEVFAENAMQDYLYPAAEAGAEAARAVKAGEYDKAWAAYQDQKQLYMKHAEQSEFTGRQTIALDSGVHKGMANMLRLEGRHKDALAHALYWVIGSQIPVERCEAKVRAYFNRCKLKNTSLDDVLAFIESRTRVTSFALIRKQVKKWIDLG
ncbi:MAG: hypothetical protein V7756_09565 [Halopseudomonas sp.]|uniref:hypothetical protein n=1 Tax=Halopseudomonas sp. TaxID=2901191 RepID=UPI0030022A43